MALTPKEWATFLLGDSQKRHTVKDVPRDPLHFKDMKRYTDRLRDAKARTQEKDAVSVFSGTLGGGKLVLSVFNFRFIGGSMGLAVGEALLMGAEKALSMKCPYLIISSSGGARMQEGIFSLMQMPRSVLAVSMLKEAALPFISLMTHPTTGGVSASFASLGDVNLAEPGAIIGFTGARVIQEILRSPLPKGFQSSEFQLKHGMVDQVVHRDNLKTTLTNLTNMLSGKEKPPSSQTL
jgi:acetyl-CoA carboxylase carboxyl transferase subunit beta